MFTKQRSSEWFSKQNETDLENGQELENIQIDYILNNLKPFHVKWLIDFYNLISTMERKIYIISGSEGLELEVYNRVFWRTYIACNIQINKKAYL